MSHARERILIFGAGDAGRMIAREFCAQGRYLEGFIDDALSMQGALIDGLPVLGNSENLASVISERSVSRLVIALPSAPAGKVKDILVRMQRTPEVEIEILPKAVRYFSGPLSGELKPSEFEYLFERDELTIDYEQLSRFYREAAVLVTGAGGSIGSELCRNLLRLGVRKLICLGRGENSIYELSASLSQLQSAHTETVFHIADVRDYENLKTVFRKENPDFCFHAAAHKHVPLMEDRVYEAIHNNCYGSDNLFRVCLETGVKRCILVSTDKAVSPSSVMGATKRVAELLALRHSGEKGTKISAVRFGNVIGSRGSVLPLFMRQIAAGKALSVTDMRMERYFMSIAEATLLMLNALTLAQGREIFVLEMGKAHKIIDIARKMLELNNIAYEDGTSVVVTGLRPGEKLQEFLYSENERVIATAHPQIHAVLTDEAQIRKSEKGLHCIIGATPDEDQQRLKQRLFEAIF